MSEHREKETFEGRAPEAAAAGAPEPASVGTPEQGGLLAGQTAVVTGGSRGIGAAVCRAFVSAGARVAFLCREKGEGAAALEKELSPSAKAYSCDVSSAAQVDRIFREILEDFGRIDILVNNAGVTRDMLLLSMKEQDFDQVIDTNLKGVFNTIRQVYPLFARQKSGKIVNVSSVAGLTGNPGQANYSASKAGVIGLTKSVAKELASRGVCCNAVAPGFIETDMTAALAREKVLASIPAGRVGKPEEVAALILFLASPLSGYITGEVVRIDGGMAM
ncbi:MAG: 3-oxoacyl-[acyl-carrier-protein] reductase [Bacillota bacterium]|nr:3-oxoacyl-[acyl-carrier-protein] reductase [Bacillota bacterium]